MKRQRRSKITTAQFTNWHQAVIADHHRLGAHLGVNSVGLGVKEVGKEITKRFCVKIYVGRKIGTDELAKQDHLPKRAKVLLPIGKGLYKSRFLPTDVIELPSIELARSSTEPFPTIPIGAQIGTGAFGRVGPGTQGCVVRHRATNRLALITAGHVVSDANGPIAPGLSVYQPDVVTPNFVVGPTIEGFVGNDPQLGAYLDFALYQKANPARGAQNTSFDGKIPTLNGAISLGETVQTAVAVQKVGAVTGYTVGLFSCFHPSFSDPALGILLNVLEFVVPPDSPTQLFADGGDSGAVVVSRSPQSFGAVVGILFARSPDKTRGLVVPFQYIQTKADLDVA